MAAAVAAAFPVYSFASGPTNSMRGAAFLSGLDDAIVVDVGRHDDRHRQPAPRLSARGQQRWSRSAACGRCSACPTSSRSASAAARAWTTTRLAVGPRQRRLPAHRGGARLRRRHAHRDRRRRRRRPASTSATAAASPRCPPRWSTRRPRAHPRHDRGGVDRMKTDAGDVPAHRGRRRLLPGARAPARRLARSCTCRTARWPTPSAPRSRRSAARPTGSSRTSPATTPSPGRAPRGRRRGAGGRRSRALSRSSRWRTSRSPTCPATRCACGSRGGGRRGRARAHTGGQTLTAAGGFAAMPLEIQAEPAGEPSRDAPMEESI